MKIRLFGGTLGSARAAERRLVLIILRLAKGT
ncbi:hypothetical protein EDF56_11549 [Novosphingobium sp. PhB165]|nr:hypothetical protein EDF56_11549 [Novosphingobium sp. PhB165]